MGNIIERENVMSDTKLNKNFFRVSAEDFKKIPGSPIAYWVSEKFINTFKLGRKIGDEAKKGLSCSGTDVFYRFFWEINICQCSINNGNKWFPITKGGPFRKWYGNNENFINWYNNGDIVKSRKDSKGKVISVIRNEEFYLKEGLSWNDVSSGRLSCRFTPQGSIPTDSGPMIYSKSKSLQKIAFLNSCVSKLYTDLLCPTIHFGVGQMAKFPMILTKEELLVAETIKKLISLSKIDWDSSETSWDFKILPLLNPDYRELTLESIYYSIRDNWHEMTLEIQNLEEENNRIYIEAYDLQDELTFDVPLKEITLTCNPYYRYGVDAEEVVSDKHVVGSEEKRTLSTKNFPLNTTIESRLLTDTMKELVSYAVGCIFGRYSLDKDGLILANAGEGLEDYLKQIPDPTFIPDKSGILPITDENDFTDDLPSQFKMFLKASFGEEHFEENLRFIEDAIEKDIRKYFIKDFFKDHVKRYKKRPIYWQISSPSGVFKALIYLHRYTKDTVGVLLNDYLRPFRKKLEAKLEQNSHVTISSDVTSGEKTRAFKNIDVLRKNIKELEDWERDVVYPLAMKRIELDLDDGVKVNYGKLGSILEKVKGLNG